MTTNISAAAIMPAGKLQQADRQITHRTKGRGGGPITRLMSPSDFGHLVKPFVFLDLAVFDEGPRTPMEYLWHPHSGIATVTVMLEGGVRIAETTGRDGVLPKGSVEFMRAGNGVWHTGQAEPGYIKVFQLWVALPPELENGPNGSHHLMPDQVPEQGPVRVILGEYSGMKSPIATPPMTYLVVNLSDGERWTYQPPQGHDVAWVAVSDGTLRTSSPIATGEMVIFERSEQSIDFVAEGATRFVIGSAPKHPHDLVLGNYSVHTSEQALELGETEIRRIGRELHDNGTLKR
ncbi:MAG: Pirin-related protein [Myxococcales bacterium]|nr:Pirin-related protein [Myxococcales bacterium]